MAFVPVANTVMAEIRSTIGGQQVENTLYFLNPGGVDLPAVIDLVDVIQAWWTGSVRVNLSDQMVFREVLITDLSAADGLSYTLSISGDPGGPVGGQPMPNSVALCVSFRTAQRGRSFRGRNYVVGLSETQVGGNYIDPAVVTAIQDGYAELIGLAGAVGWAWCVVSRTANNVPRLAGVATPVTAVVAVDNVVDSQRRRLPGRGR